MPLHFAEELSFTRPMRIARSRGLPHFLTSALALQFIRRLIYHPTKLFLLSLRFGFRRYKIKLCCTDFIYKFFAPRELLKFTQLILELLIFILMHSLLGYGLL